MSTAPPEVDIRAELLGRHSAALEALHRLTRRIEYQRWAIVGGMMVLVLARRHGTRARRAEPTKDADIVVDVVAHGEVLEAVVHELTVEQGFELADSIGSGDAAARCTFVSGMAQIDVLCPSDATTDQLDASGLRSLAIPGGRRALETAEPIELHFSDDYPNLVVRVPTLAGALVVKAAAAIDERTAESPRHIQDVVTLLSLDADPAETASALSDGDRSVLARLADRLADDTDAAWVGVSAADRAISRATYAYLSAS
jgi:hypothetical protein